VIRAGTLVDALALNLDFPATILELAGVPLAWSQSGHSLVPLLQGPVPADWRKEFLYENYRDPEYADVTFDIVGVRTEQAKLVEYPGHPEWTQVFNLAADPYELRNLSTEPAAADLVSDLRVLLEARKRATDFGGGSKQP
jgi:arylsulfatase A-like enzyme